MITHDRWQLIKEIFQSAQEKSPTERLGFLDEVCGDDKSIREEVEALLTADDSNDDFLDTPAYELAAGMLAGETEFKPNQKVGRYTILHQLGTGGMGQIYLAQDEQLGRKIALKLIATEFATDPRRVLRFEQEARAASALNHPNVCVIHETGVTDHNRHFIAMEYIQGTTLRDKLALGPITPLEAVHIAIQVAAALAAAHAAGIVHRDIKPENIMLRPDGYVKVLDFGLAKLTEKLPGPEGVSSVSTKVRTEAGTLMGTVKYMSPEQLREAELDERTDIWSLGVVLYEMLTRTTPFEAKSPADTIAIILAPHEPALSLSDEVPARFRQIVKNALAKDRALRYQTVTKLALDLTALQRELEREADNDLPHRLPSPLAYGSPAVGEKTRIVTAGSAIFTRIKSQAIQTADFLFTEIKSHKAATLAGFTLVLALLVYLPWLVRNLGGPTQQPIPQIGFLTNSGNAMLSAIAKDGKVVAHVEQGDGKQRIMLTSTVTYGSSVLVPDEPLKYLGLTFSPDNLYLYFTRNDKDRRSNLYRLPVHGGTPAKIKEAVDSPISFSPLGDYFAFVRLDRVNGEYLLIVSDVGGTNEQVLATRKDNDSFSFYGLSWSPDGSTIVCPAGSWEEGYHLDLLAFDVKGGPPRKIGDRSWSSVYQVAWEDMNSLVFSARTSAATPHQIWRVSYPDGEIHQLTFGLNDYMGVSVAGNKIVTVRTDRSWDLWVAHIDEPKSAKAITSGVGLNYGVSWTTKGYIVFSSMVQDQLQILRVDPDGANKVQLTHVGDNFTPAASADGRLIVFASNRNRSHNIWSMNAEDGSDAKQLTFTDGNYYPSVSADNQWIAYDNQVKMKLSVWKVPLQGGTPVKVVDRFRMPVFSPDHKYIAARYDAESGSENVAIFPADGGEPVQTVPVPEQDWQRVYFLDDRTLSFVKNNNGYSNIWTYDLITRTEKQLTHFNSEQIYAYSFSPDLKRVAAQRGRKTSSVVTVISSER